VIDGISLHAYTNPHPAVKASQPQNDGAKLYQIFLNAKLYTLNIAKFSFFMIFVEKNRLIIDNLDTIFANARKN